MVFGQVPSRLLGQSLGINNIPPKFCSYSCVYCQLGRTIETKNCRRSYTKNRILDESRNVIKESVKQLATKDRIVNKE